MRKLILVALLMIAGCNKPKTWAEGEIEKFPPSFTDVKHEGGHWFSFTYEGHRFLCARSVTNHGTISSCVRVD